MRGRRKPCQVTFLVEPVPFQCSASFGQDSRAAMVLDLKYLLAMTSNYLRTCTLDVVDSNADAFDHDAPFDFVHSLLESC